MPAIGFYGAGVVDVASRVSSSPDVVLDLIAIHRHYLAEGRLEVSVLGPEIDWYDLASYESWLSASFRLHEMERLTGRKVACLEEICRRPDDLSSFVQAPAAWTSMPVRLGQPVPSADRESRCRSGLEASFRDCTTRRSMA